MKRLTILALLAACSPSTSPDTPAAVARVEFTAAAVYDAQRQVLGPVSVGPNIVEPILVMAVSHAGGACEIEHRWPALEAAGTAQELMWAVWTLPTSEAEVHHTCPASLADELVERLVGPEVRLGVGPGPTAWNTDEELGSTLLDALIDLGTVDTAPYAFALSLGDGFIPDQIGFMPSEEVFTGVGLAQAEFILQDSIRWSVPLGGGDIEAEPVGVRRPEVGYALPGARDLGFETAILIGAFSDVRSSPLRARELVAGLGTKTCPAPVKNGWAASDCEGRDDTRFSGFLSTDNAVFGNLRSWSPRHDLLVDGTWGPCPFQTEVSWCSDQLAAVDAFASEVWPKKLEAQEYRFDLLVDGEVELHMFEGTVIADDSIRIEGLLDLPKLANGGFADGEGIMDLTIDGVRYLSGFEAVPGAPGCIHVDIDDKPDILCLFP